MAKKSKLPAPSPATAWHPSARKLGEAVHFSFVCCIKRGMKCEMPEAENIFESAVKSGIIIKTGMAGFLQDVPKYRMK